MDYEEERVDMTQMTEEDFIYAQKESEFLFKLNHTMPRTEEYMEILKKFFGENLGENSMIMAPLAGAALDRLVIGNNVYINSNCLAMSRGGIKIEDNVMLASNVQVLSNNHDLYKRHILTCQPVHIKEGAWIGAGATILPGVTIGKYAVVGASAVVTKDVPDYGVVVGSPAKLIRTLDADKFEE